MRTSLLITVAAASLLAGGSLALAQDSGRGHEAGAGAAHSGAQAPEKTSGATRAGGEGSRAKGDAGAGGGNHAQAQTHEPTKQANGQGRNEQGPDSKAASTKGGTTKAAESKTGATEHRSATSETDPSRGRTAHDGQAHDGQAHDMQAHGSQAEHGTADRRDAANHDSRADGDRAGGGRDTARTGHENGSKDAKLTETIRGQHSENIRDVDFSVRVGGMIPERHHLLPLPSDIISIYPEYRSYDYVVADDTIVIVDPSSRKIIRTLNEGRSVGTNPRAKDCR